MASFSLDISAFARKAQGRMDLVVRKIALDLFRRIILRTPVGNPDLWESPAPPGYVGGRARANWHVDIGRMSPRVLKSIDKTGEITTARATAALRNAKAGVSIFIINNLPYIIPLERGWSSQAPAGMVAVTIREYQAVVRRAAEQAKKERR